eukprot:7680287-Prorocentrum_lima.AAC.1
MCTQKVDHYQRYVAETPAVRVVIEAFGKQWTCNITEAIPRDGIEREEETTSLMLLGMAVEVVQGK